MAEPFLVARNLRKSFNGHQAVQDVSFTIEKGEIFGLLGPNGAGKTTTIRILSTVLSPDHGDVTIGGYSLRDKRQPEADRLLPPGSGPLPGPFRPGQSHLLRENGRIERQRSADTGHR